MGPWRSDYGRSPSAKPPENLDRGRPCLPRNPGFAGTRGGGKSHLLRHVVPKASAGACITRVGETLTERQALGQGPPCSHTRRALVRYKAASSLPEAGASTRNNNNNSTTS